MQRFEYLRSHFHNEGGDCEKSYFEVFSGSGPICHSQKPEQTPPSRFLLKSLRSSPWRFYSTSKKLKEELFYYDVARKMLQDTGIKTKIVKIILFLKSLD